MTKKLALGHGVSDNIIWMSQTMESLYIFSIGLLRKSMVKLHSQHSSTQLCSVTEKKFTTVVPRFYPQLKAYSDKHVQGKVLKVRQAVYHFLKNPLPHFQEVKVILTPERKD